MRQPPNNTMATIIRFPDETIDRIDALIGRDQRGAFIRHAVEKELAEIEKQTPRCK
jgi:predicted DNA-binding protein